LAYVTIPKDLTKVKSKVLFGLTKRQLICFTPAVLIGVPLAVFLAGDEHKATHDNSGKKIINIQNSRTNTYLVTNA